MMLCLTLVWNVRSIHTVKRRIMTQEDKNILLKDLCMRIPYRTFVCLNPGAYNKPETCILTGVHGEHVHLNVDSDPFRIDNIKPYLRPMSNMTDEELKELNDKYGSIAYFFTQESPYYHGLQVQHSDIGSIEISEFSEIYDWLNAHHFDYRGLIESGLALEAPEGMYKND